MATDAERERYQPLDEDLLARVAAAIGDFLGEDVAEEADEEEEGECFDAPSSG